MFFRLLHNSLEHQKRNGSIILHHLNQLKAEQMVVDTPKEVLIERRPYEEPLPFPRTAANHIRALLFERKRKRTRIRRS
jgi:hypothetical protein